MATQEPRIGHLISPELLEALRTAFPLKPPRLDETERQIFMKVGQQSVVDFLQYHLDNRVAQALGNSKP
jgi:hypothetical protein